MRSAGRPVDLLLRATAHRFGDEKAAAEAAETEGLDEADAALFAALRKRRLEIARALATEPRLLLLDEPAAGMNPQETAALKELVLQIRDQFGLTILLIEHDMSMVMSISERIYVMEYGCLIAEGTPEAVSHDPRVIKAYLGEVEHA